MQVHLIGCEHSYFTGKVRGYLRWKGLPFTEILSSAAIYRSTILPKVGWPVVPVLIVAQEGIPIPPTMARSAPRRRYVQDTSDIIDEVEKLVPIPPVVPGEPRLALTAALCELLADCWLVLPAMYYRWCFPEQRPYMQREWGAALAPEQARRPRAPPVFTPLLTTSSAPRVRSRWSSSWRWRASRCRSSRRRRPSSAQARAWRRRSNARSSACWRCSRHTLRATPSCRHGIAWHRGGSGTHMLCCDVLCSLQGSRPTLADFAFIGPFYAHIYHDPV